MSRDTLNHVRVIQGDGVNATNLNEILEAVVEQGFSASNIAFGMGGALLQGLNRDTQKFAMKCSEVVVNEAAVPVFKDPITDPSKQSKRGRLELVRQAQTYQTIPAAHLGATPSELVLVYENGTLLREYTLEEVRARAYT